MVRIKNDEKSVGTFSLNLILKRLQYLYKQTIVRYKLYM